MALLTGMTPDGQEVPVQVDTNGRLIAEGLTGPQGPQGLQGPTGPLGPQGPIGPAGSPADVWSKNGGADVYYNAGRVLVGTSSTSADHRAIFQSTPADSTGFGQVLVARGSSTGLSDGSALGVIGFSDSGHVKAAQIAAFVDGGYTTGTDMPSRLVFSTTADGASSPTERMTIKATGTINYSNVAVYAGNTEARAGGLVIGDVYRKSDGTLMIAY